MTDPLPPPDMIASAQTYSVSFRWDHADARGPVFPIPWRPRPTRRGQQVAWATISVAANDPLDRDEVEVRLTGNLIENGHATRAIADGTVKLDALPDELAAILWQAIRAQSKSSTLTMHADGADADRQWRGLRDRVQWQRTVDTHAGGDNG